MKLFNIHKGIRKEVRKGSRRDDFQRLELGRGTDRGKLRKVIKGGLGGANLERVKEEGTETDRKMPRTGTAAYIPADARNFSVQRRKTNVKERIVVDSS